LITQNIFNSPASLILYIAYRGSEAVGCAALFLTDGVAGLYYVGTLPSHRGKGIGSALTMHCLNNARNLRCKRAVLRASESGERIYMRMGFKKFGEFKKFIWNRHPYRNIVWKAKYLLGIAVDKAMEDAIWFS
jgi:GNAT superfamily N-acetyltransferase